MNVYPAILKVISSDRDRSGNFSTKVKLNGTHYKVPRRFTVKITGGDGRAGYFDHKRLNRAEPDIVRFCYIKAQSALIRNLERIARPGGVATLRIADYS